MSEGKLRFFELDTFELSRNEALSLFFGEGSQLWAFISQSFLDKNTKFLCSLDWKFPEFFKTHPTFIFRPFPRPVMGIWTLIPVFLGTPCTFYQKQLRRKWYLNTNVNILPCIQKYKGSKTLTSLSSKCQFLIKSCVPNSTRNREGSYKTEARHYRVSHKICTFVLRGCVTYNFLAMIIISK